jgi:uncharacterized protein YjgD (DUF1641 family)
MTEQEEEIRRAIGIINYVKLRQAINKANAEMKKVYHITKNNKVIENKELIEKTYPNIKVMNEKEWLTFCYQKLTPEERKKVDKKIINEIKKK